MQVSGVHRDTDSRRDPNVVRIHRPISVILVLKRGFIEMATRPEASLKRDEKVGRGSRSERLRPSAPRGAPCRW